MSATATTYKLPSADEIAWIDDLMSSLTSRLDDFLGGLTRPFDGNPDTHAESVTFEYVGRVFTLTRTVRDIAEYLEEASIQIEKNLMELRWAQEDEDSEHESHPVDDESYIDWARRRVRLWEEAAASARDTLARAEAREGGNA